MLILESVNNLAICQCDLMLNSFFFLDRRKGEACGSEVASKVHGL